jgi:molybdate transport system regulatory protein
MQLSIRNRFDATVESVTAGTAMTIVRIQMAGGATLTSAITHDSAADLGLAVGSPVTALVKSTDVAIAVG